MGDVEWGSGTPEWESRSGIYRVGVIAEWELWSGSHRVVAVGKCSKSCDWGLQVAE